MSNESNNIGRAYEYAWMNALYNALKDIRKTTIIENTSLDANKKAWDLISNEMQETLKISAESAIKEICELEPLMIENENDDLVLEFQKDEQGKKGDVRDIVIKRGSISWEVGLSIKHNHEAIKHSRLSKKLDFGKEWFNVPCSNEYWNAVTPIFEKLSKNSRELKMKQDLIVLFYL